MRVPKKLGRYEVLKPLGKGAMGIVYLARDPLIGRVVAIKTFYLKDMMSDAEAEEYRKRFLREAQSAGILSHPNIVTIHDVQDETTRENIPFIAMEYVEGENLKDLLKKGKKFSLEEISKIINQIADALDYAHSHKVIHRDIKPANIMITKDGKVKITDFGVAKLETTDMTSDGRTIGTPNYMSPEQARGEKADHRSDIFSLGVMLYELVTGKKPFESPNIARTLQKIMYEPPTPPEKIVPDIHPEIKKVLIKALEKDPDKRFQSAKELAQAFEKAVEVATGKEKSSEPIVHKEKSVVTVVKQLITEEKSSKLKVIYIGITLIAVLGLFFIWKLISKKPPDKREKVEVVSSVSLQEDIKLRKQVSAKIEEIEEFIKAGNYETARNKIIETLMIDPENQTLKEMLKLTEQQLAATTEEDQDQKPEEEKEVEQDLSYWLNKANFALKDRRYQNAIDFANKALEIDKDNEIAKKILEAAKRAKKRLEEFHASRKQVPRLQTDQKGGKTASAVNVTGHFTLNIDFLTELPEGVLTIYVDNKQILREKFSFYVKKSLFRKEPRPGRIQARRKIKAGEKTFKIYVAFGPQGPPTQNIELTEFIPPNDEVTLMIKVNKNALLEAALGTLEE